MKKLQLINVLLLLFIPLSAQEYRNWDSHDVIRFYEKKEVSLGYNSLDQNGDPISNQNLIYFVPVNIKAGIYDIEVYEKISSKLWKIKSSNIYVYFRYNPYLYKFDEGVLVVDNYSGGTFYKKP